MHGLIYCSALLMCMFINFHSVTNLSFLSRMMNAFSIIWYVVAQLLLYPFISSSWDFAFMAGISLGLQMARFAIILENWNMCSTREREKPLSHSQYIYPNMVLVSLMQNILHDSPNCNSTYGWIENLFIHAGIYNMRINSSQ